MTCKTAEQSGPFKTKKSEFPKTYSSELNTSSLRSNFKFFAVSFV